MLVFCGLKVILKVHAPIPLSRVPSTGSQSIYFTDACSLTVSKLGLVAEWKTEELCSLHIVSKLYFRT